MEECVLNYRRSSDNILYLIIYGVVINDDDESIVNFSKLLWMEGIMMKECCLELSFVATMARNCCRLWRKLQIKDQAVIYYDSAINDNKDENIAKL